LPAPALRRPAPASRHRAGARPSPVGTALRRGDLGPRPRVDRLDRLAPEGTAGRSRPVDPVHHPRDGHGAAGRGLRGEARARAHRRVRNHRGTAPRSALGSRALAAPRAGSRTGGARRIVLAARLLLRVGSGRLARADVRTTGESRAAAGGIHRDRQRRDRGQREHRSLRCGCRAHPGGRGGTGSGRARRRTRRARRGYGRRRARNRLPGACRVSLAVAAPVLLGQVHLGNEVPLDQIPALVFPALGDTLIMVGIVMAIVVALGIPLGALIHNLGPDGLVEDRPLHTVLSWVVSVGRSLPFLILMAAIVPFTRFITGTNIGIPAAVV